MIIFLIPPKFIYSCSLHYLVGISISWSTQTLEDGFLHYLAYWLEIVIIIIMISICLWMSNAAIQYNSKLQC